LGFIRPFLALNAIVVDVCTVWRHISLNLKTLSRKHYRQVW